MGSTDQERAATQVRRRRLVSLISGACWLGILAVWGVTRGVAESAWWGSLLLYLPQAGYALPVLPLLLLSARQRNRTALAINTASLLVVAGPMMGFNLPRPRYPAPPSAPRVRVLAYNILGPRGSLEEVREHVRSYRPDVVVFSEARHYRQDARFFRELTALFPGWHSTCAADVFVASRWAFRETHHTPLIPADVTDPSTEREIVHAAVRAPFGEFQVVGVHFRAPMYPITLRKERHRLDRYLNHTGAERTRQLRALEQYLLKVRGPVLLCGDFNTPPAGRIYSRLTQGYRDAFSEVGLGWGYTYPSSFPLLRIDYVFCSAHWNTLRAVVGPKPGSDHRPLFVELALHDAR